MSLSGKFFGKPRLQAAGLVLFYHFGLGEFIQFFINQGEMFLSLVFFAGNDEFFVRLDSRLGFGGALQVSRAPGFVLAQGFLG